MGAALESKSGSEGVDTTLAARPRGAQARLGRASDTSILLEEASAARGVGTGSARGVCRGAPLRWRSSYRRGSSCRAPSMATVVLDAQAVQL